MPRTCLTKEQIKELLELLSDVFNYLKKLKSQNILAEKIQFPKIPAVLSESITIHLIKENIILKELKNRIVDINFGGRKSDIIIKTNSNEDIKIEVKATGKSAFEYFGEKDISADYLIWVSFGDFFLNSTKKSADIVIVKNPSQYFKEPIKITLSQLKEFIGNNLETFELEMSKL